MSKITKAVFPVAGIGTRFLPATKAYPKEMLPIVDKPLVQYAVEEAINAGIKELIFIIGQSKYAITDHFNKADELELLLEKKGKMKELNSIKNQTIREFFNSKEVAEINETISANRKHSYCDLCYQQEDMGLCSGRMAGVPVRADSDFPAQIDIKFNNLCNLACKMCDPVSSSKLATEWKQLGWVGEDTPYLDTNSMTILPNWTKVDYQQNKK